jgi:hypothetical protein
MPLSEFKNVRVASNYRHGSITPPFESALEMPMPEFESGHGWFSPRGNSKFGGTRDGFIDFNFKECTGNTGDWKFAYLMGESEYNKNYGKPPEWSRNNWKFNDTRPNNTASKLSECGLNANTLFTNGRGFVSGNKKFRPYTRRANNLSNRCMWGVMESPKFQKNKYTTHDYSGKSHHVRAGAITFRYHVHFNEDKSSGISSLNNQHGGNPIEAFCLAYVKKTDSTIYLAECITVSKEQMKDDSPFPPNSVHQWIANSNMNSYSQSNTHNDRKVWQEHGPRNNTKWEVNVDGVATLTISKAAAEKVWDNKMVCVGFVATSVHSSRQSGYVGSSMWFDMWDVKLLEMEYRGQTNYSTSGGEEDPKFTRVLRPPTTKKQNLEYYHDPGEMFTMDLVE